MMIFFNISFVAKLSKEVLEENSVKMLEDKYSVDLEASIKRKTFLFSHFILECDLPEKRPVYAVKCEVH